MKISCVIPSRDRRLMVADAIASVLQQDTPVDEIIVVDDGSVDNTSAYIKARFSDVQLLRLGGLGPGSARNAGVAASRGDIIMFLDADDIWLSGHVGELRDTLAQGFDVAYGVSRTRDMINGGEFLVPAADEARQGDCFAALLRWCFLLPSSVAVTRRAFLRVGGFTDNGGMIGEDWLFFLCLAQEFAFGFSDREITLRNLHAGSLCSQIDAAELCFSLRMIRDNLISADIHPENDDVFARFLAIERWVTDNGADWTSVQDWYLSMKEGGMI